MPIEPTNVTPNHSPVPDTPEAPGIDLTDALSEVSVPDLGEMSPDMILALVEQRLRGLDSQIEARSRDLLRNTEQANALSEKLEALSAITAAASSNDGDKISWDNTKGKEGHMVLMAGETYGSVQELAAAVGLEAELEQLVGGDKIKASDVQDIADQIRQELERINSGNEFQMMRLQRLVQERSEAVSLASNLMRKLDQGTEAIIRNIGV